MFSAKKDCISFFYCTFAPQNETVFTTSEDILNHIEDAVPFAKENLTNS